MPESRKEKLLKSKQLRRDIRRAIVPLLKAERDGNIAVGLVRDAVDRVHEATTLVTLFINGYVRHAFDTGLVNSAEEADFYLADLFRPNFLKTHVFQLLTSIPEGGPGRPQHAAADLAEAAEDAGLSKPTSVEALQQYFDDDFSINVLAGRRLPSRSHLGQALEKEAVALAAAARTHVQEHLPRLVHDRFKRIFRRPPNEWRDLGDAAKRAHHLRVRKAAADACRVRGQPRQLPANDDWSEQIESHRTWLDLDEASAGSRETIVKECIAGRPQRYLWALVGLQSHDANPTGAAYSGVPAAPAAWTQPMIAKRKEVRDISRAKVPRDAQGCQIRGDERRAWEHTRQGRLNTAREELRALRAAAPDSLAGDEGEARIGSYPAVYPLRSRSVPRHMQFDRLVLQEVLQLGGFHGELCGVKSLSRANILGHPAQVMLHVTQAADADAIEKASDAMADEVAREKEAEFEWQRKAVQLLRQQGRGVEAAEAEAELDRALAAAGHAPLRRSKRAKQELDKASGKEKVLKAGGVTKQTRERRAKAETFAHARRVLATVFDLRDVHQRWLVAGTGCTDGYGIYFHIHRPQLRPEVPPERGGGPQLSPAERRNGSQDWVFPGMAELVADGQRPTVVPRRGMWTPEQLRSATGGKSVDDMIVIGVDPGMHDLIHLCVRRRPGQDAGVRDWWRYTRKQRAFDIDKKRFDQGMKAAEATDGELRQAAEAERTAESQLSLTNHKAANLEAFHEYAHIKVATFDACHSFYARAEWRERRREAHIRKQQSLEGVVAAIKALAYNFDQSGTKPIVLAYGSWGMSAGRANRPCTHGLPPTIGVGLMRFLALHFVVVVTPEKNTTKTCHDCGGVCGPWRLLDVEAGIDQKAGFKASQHRGVRYCEICRQPRTRDRNAALNIADVFVHLYNRQALPAAFVSDEDEEELLRHGEDLGAPDPQEQLWHGDELGLERDER